MLLKTFKPPNPLLLGTRSPFSGLGLSLFLLVGCPVPTPVCVQRLHVDRMRSPNLLQSGTISFSHCWAAVPQVTPVLLGLAESMCGTAGRTSFLSCHRLLDCSSADNPSFTLVCFDSFQTCE